MVYPLLLSCLVDVSGEREGDDNTVSNRLIEDIRVFAIQTCVRRGHFVRIPAFGANRLIIAFTALIHSETTLTIKCFWMNVALPNCTGQAGPINYDQIGVLCALSAFFIITLLAIRVNSCTIRAPFGCVDVVLIWVAHAVMTVHALVNVGAL